MKAVSKKADGVTPLQEYENTDEKHEPVCNELSFANAHDIRLSESLNYAGNTIIPKLLEMELIRYILEFPRSEDNTKTRP